MFLVDACESFDIFAEKQEDGKYKGKVPWIDPSDKIVKKNSCFVLYTLKMDPAYVFSGKILHRFYKKKQID